MNQNYLSNYFKFMKFYALFSKQFVTDKTKKDNKTSIDQKYFIYEHNFKNKRSM
jgi:hypothetical protein